MCTSKRTRSLVLVLSLTIATIFCSAHAFVVAENPNNALDTFPNRPGDNIGPDINAPTLVIEFGKNIALGGLGNCFGFGCRDDFDAFRIQVPAGLQINSTELLVVNPDGTAEQLWVFPGPTNGIGILRDPSLDGPLNSNPEWKAGALFALTDNLGNGAGPKISTTVLGPGYYDIVAYNFAFIGAGVWEATFNAGAQIVPLPAGVWFVGSGLVAVFGLARRRTPAAT